MRRRSPLTVSSACVEYAEEENEDGREQDCVYATCDVSGDTAGPIWGHEQASVKRALATLTEECSCGATFHMESEEKAEPEKEVAMEPKERSIVIRKWEPCEKNTLRGFFTVELASGLILHRMMLHEQNQKRWIKPPSREWIDPAGNKAFAPLIDWRDETVKQRFLDQVLAALDNYRKGQDGERSNSDSLSATPG